MSSTSNMLTVQDFTPLKILIFFTAEGEYILEFCCLLGGWLTIFIRPGLAILRCFRVFRLLWFYEVIVFKATMEEVFNPILGEQFVGRCFKMMRFAIKALTALGNEMFRLTNATRGGLLLMMVFFYSAFILGTSLWVETEGSSGQCNTRSHCTYTLMRLTFYDGDAFNFVYTLTTNHKFLFFLCIVYMCLTSFGILNGLVGIFGTAFAAASDEAFHEPSGSEAGDEYGDGGDAADRPDGGGEDQDQRQMQSKRLASLVFRSFKGLDVGDDSAGSGGAAEILSDGGSRRNSSASQTNNKNQIPFQGQPGAESSTSPRALGSDAMYSDEEGGPGQHEDTDAEDLRAQCDQLPTPDKAAMQRQLMGKLGGKSAFALHELKKASEHGHNNGNSNTSGGGSGKGSQFKRLVGTAAARYSDAGKVTPLGNAASGPEDPLDRNQPGVPGAPAQSASPSAPPLKTMRGSHAVAAAVGVFARSRNVKTNKSLLQDNNHNHNTNHNPFAMKRPGGVNSSAAHHSNAAHLGGSAHDSAELKALTLNVQALTRTVEVQNDMIIALYVQILALKRDGAVTTSAAEGHGEPVFPRMTPSPHMSETVARLNAAAHDTHQVGGSESPGKVAGILHSLQTAQHAVQGGIGHTLDKMLHRSGPVSSVHSPVADDTAAPTPTGPCPSPVPAGVAQAEVDNCPAVERAAPQQQAQQQQKRLLPIEISGPALLHCDTASTVAMSPLPSIPSNGTNGTANDSATTTTTASTAASTPTAPALGPSLALVSFPALPAYRTKFRAL